MTRRFYHIADASNIDDEVFFEMIFQAVDLGSYGGVVYEHIAVTPDIFSEHIVTTDKAPIVCQKIDNLKLTF